MPVCQFHRYDASGNHKPALHTSAIQLLRKSLAPHRQSPAARPRRLTSPRPPPLDAPLSPPTGHGAFPRRPRTANPNPATSFNPREERGVGGGGPTSSPASLPPPTRVRTRQESSFERRELCLFFRTRQESSFEHERTRGCASALRRRKYHRLRIYVFPLIYIQFYKFDVNGILKKRMTLSSAALKSF
jgi:hypothetical protein